MIQNYVNTIETIQLYVYSGDNPVSADAEPTATAVNVETGDAVTLQSVATVPSGSGYDYYEVALDPSEVTTTKQVKITWSYTYSGSSYTNVEYVNVVRPYFTANELWDFNSDFASGGATPKTVDEIQLVERRVRNLIDSYCRQGFQDLGKRTESFIGGGTDDLHLPWRIYKLHKVSTDNITLFERDGGGNVTTEIVTWDDSLPDLIRTKIRRAAAFGDVKADISPGLLSPRATFQTDRIYYVEAGWGWDYLPDNVTQAALILADDHFNENDIYHQQNITVLRSADYRMEFGRDHYTTTGNTHADQMLENYVNNQVYMI